jgi:hypothetical protein
MKVANGIGVKRLYNQHLDKNVKNGNFPKFNSIKSSHYRSASLHTLKNPETVDDIDENAEIFKIDGESSQSIIKYKSDKILIMSLEEFFPLLNDDSIVLFFDGTFYTSTPLFRQLLLLWGYLPQKNTFLTLGYALSMSKCKSEYVEFFKNFKILIEENTQGSFLFDEIHCDYETAIVSSIKKTLKVNSRGCYFHYSSALRRNFLEHLSKSHLKNQNILLAYKKLKFLSFLPTEFIPETFIKLKNTSPPEMKSFIKYFNDTWLNKTYHLDSWNFFSKFNHRTDHSF